jgi:hypothetical protein
VPLITNPPRAAISLLSSRRSHLFRNRRRRTHCITLIPLARNLLMVLTTARPFCVFFLIYAIALLLLFALTWISKCSESLLCWSTGWWRLLYVVGIRCYAQCYGGRATVAMVVGGGVHPPSLPLPFSGADDLVTRGFQWDERAETCRLCIEQKFPFCARRMMLTD